jgi:photosystem II stability/assembly factor-like uncharacterized protein
LETEPLVDRRRRATALIALAAISIAGASFAFLYSAQSPRLAQESDSPLLVTSDFVTYSFISPNEGWALNIASDTAPTPGRLAVFRTVDRGRHWEEKFSRSTDFFGYQTVSLQTMDRAHSFIFVDYPAEWMLRTTDGGAHWDPVALPAADVGVVVFSDINHGWLLTQWPQATLYETRDAGATWQPLPAPPIDAYRLSLRSPTEAWLTGSATGPPHVYSSTDGGHSWQRHQLPPPPGGSWDSGSYLESRVDLLPRTGVVATILPPDGAARYMATSFDGGATWLPVQPPPSTVAYQDSSHWWALAGSTLFKSSDAGQIWTRATNTLPDWLYIPELHILDPSHAWVSVSIPASLSAPGGSGLAFTDDGGLHWTRAQVPHAS